MLEILTQLDALMAGWLPPVVRIALWAAVSSIVSMGLYACLSPQEKLVAIKTEHKQVRRSLFAYDGEFAGMWKLISRDLTLACRQLGLILVPFLVAVTPVVALIFYLPDVYGSSWTQTLELWFIAVLLVVSLVIKIRWGII